MIRKEDCLQIGVFTKTHGLNGDLILSVENDFPEKYEEESIFVDIDGGLVPFFIDEDGLNPRNHQSYRIKLEDVDSSEAASRFVDCPVYLFSNLFTDEDTMSLKMLEGFILSDDEKGELGEIERVDDFNGNIVFTVEINSIEVMIPLVEEQVLDINYEAKTMLLQLPEGLLDVYLEE